MSPSPLDRDPSTSPRAELLRSPESETDLAELAARFSAKSGGGLSPELSTDLALEIVFNEIVEQACLATGATGAAIVLWRDGELVCRATSGMTAPALGSRLDPSSGISGECIRNLSTQRCDDVLADKRADVVAAKQLGIRSLIVMPILRGEKLLGIFELFSSRPAAFGERDQRTLEVLVSRTQTNIDRAAQPLSAPEPPRSVAVPGIAPAKPAVNVVEEREVAPDPPRAPYMASLPSLAPAIHSVKEDPIDSSPVEITEQKAERPGLDVPTLALAVAVLICAIALGVLVGRHFGIQVGGVRWISSPAAARASTAAPAANASTARGSGESASSAEATQKQTATEPAHEPVAAKPAGEKSETVPPGGLLVSQNGKEVFRLPPGQSRANVAQNQPVQNRAAAAAQLATPVAKQPASQRPATVDPNKPMEISPSEADDNLLYRVEPDYPDDARKQGIQGAVVLDVLIAGDGKVENVHVDSGPPQLAQACIDAIKQWRYRPRKQNGLEVPVHTTVTLNFRLPSQPS
jgi:TonB family protein